ncbi:unnamed protein product [Periconia digitata]|uniref:Uncharacterized protein n=1 Tax=Periconia digitata TaxID=1303443 RepID=A0A9W4XM34_9PLEO|nr:unnamed protein product [Periconia digitata]
MLSPQLRILPSPVSARRLDPRAYSHACNRIPSSSPNVRETLGARIILKSRGRNHVCLWLETCRMRSFALLWARNQAFQRSIEWHGMYALLACTGDIYIDHPIPCPEALSLRFCKIEARAVDSWERGRNADDWTWEVLCSWRVPDSSCILRIVLLEASAWSLAFLRRCFHAVIAVANVVYLEDYARMTQVAAANVGNCTRSCLRIRRQILAIVLGPDSLVQVAKRTS